MFIKNRLKQHIPIIKCQTCGKIANQNKVFEMEAPSLLQTLNHPKRKTWARLVKDSFNVYYGGAQKRRNKRIFYASCLQRCIEKKHRLEVIHLYGIKFHESFRDTLNVPEEE